MTILLFGILGLAFGSFINATVWRLHEGRNFTTERSICEHCEHVLAAKDLVPLLSWLYLRGQCRYCSKSISIQNPISELLTGTVFVLSYVYWPLQLADFSSWVQFGLWLGIVTVLVGLLLYDVKWLELPDRLMRALAVLVLTSVIITVFTAEDSTGLVKDSVFGFLVGGGIFYALYQVSDGRWIGGGDVKLGFVMGLYVGALGATLALLIGFYSATLYILPLMALKKIDRTSKVPFGPFLILGFYSVGLWYEPISNWFRTLIGL